LIRASGGYYRITRKRFRSGLIDFDLLIPVSGASPYKVAVVPVQQGDRIWVEMQTVIGEDPVDLRDR
jgi:hypothetical protein